MDNTRKAARWLARAIAILSIFQAAAAESTGALRDIHGPIPVASPGMWLRRALLAAVLAALLALAWVWWRRRKADAEPERPTPPDEIARRRLEAAMALIEEPERFCTAVSEAARAYLEGRFGLRAPEQTTEEFLAELGRNGRLAPGHRTLLEDFLTCCDLAKFAQFDPGRGELERLHAAALRLVNETAPPLPGAITPANPAETAVA